jgi:hypothetical protein
LINRLARNKQDNYESKYTLKNPNLLIEIKYTTLIDMEIKPSVFEFFKDLVRPEIFAIGIFAYFGVFVRGLISRSLTDSLVDRRPVAIQQFQEQGFLLLLFYNSYFIPNIVGCCIIGFLVRRKVNIVKYLGEPLYTGG